MMKSLVVLSRALVVVAALAVVPGAAKAQSLSSSAGSSFEAYRAMAITAGVIGGAVVATVVTDGLILPILAGGGRGGLAGVAEQLVSTAGTVFGAVAGGLYADDWYSKQ
ncbi:MAG: hypothetical protein RLO51_07485 [Thalassobaculum sp.]|uniref:hypothetical protein n=1 Tax=Thalassobaculum sp. TaxID=2022740 RepID=UPI0032EB0829